MKSRAVTPVAFVRTLLLGYERYGLDSAQALAKAQITPAMLQRGNQRISAEQMELVSEAAMRELDDEALGWWQRRLPWGSYDLLARTGRPIKQIAQAVGFNSEKSFARAFRGWVGQSPSEWRKAGATT